MGLFMVFRLEHLPVEEGQYHRCIDQIAFALRLGD